MHEHGLPDAVEYALPRIEQHPQLALAPDERRELAGRQIQAAAHPARLHDAVERDRISNPLEPLRPSSSITKMPRISRSDAPLITTVSGAAAL